ncbi:hypothetical protein BDN70DRAFT_917507 [Pholiota conissans]|uniref:Uncharacterized protein n=1 Tax=Pholiota conissans TaxID=109636 RepID=A0A9P6CZ15_9AGAR|nr:hypothetical protein BDN70DRAFT_917507 [Pholiota conissans]
MIKNGLPVEDDAGWALLPCSSSDLDLVAGTRLVTGESLAAVKAKTVGGVGERLEMRASSRAERAGGGVDEMSREGLVCVGDSMVVLYCGDGSGEQGGVWDEQDDDEMGVVDVEEISQLAMTSISEYSYQFPCTKVQSASPAYAAKISRNSNHGTMRKRRYRVYIDEVEERNQKNEQNTLPQVSLTFKALGGCVKADPRA